MQKLKKNTALPDVVQMLMVNPYAAGIDIGDTIHAVAIPEGLDDKRVQTFGTMTCDLEAIAAWLIKTGITTVAMESTGVYWEPLFSLLNKKAFEVYLVNARQVKNVTGRKTDEGNAVWLQKLHSCDQFIHLFIVFAFIVIYFLVYPKIKLLHKNILLYSILLALITWSITTRIIIPLSKIQPPPFNFVKELRAISILFFCIGLPNTVLAKHFYRKKELDFK